jgi:hypothetical protein
MIRHKLFKAVLLSSISMPVFTIHFREAERDKESIPVAQTDAQSSPGPVDA